jgi:hypothetical protein
MSDHQLLHRVRYCTDSKCRNLRSTTSDVWTLNGAIYSGPRRKTPFAVRRFMTIPLCISNNVGRIFQKLLSVAVGRKRIFLCRSLDPAYPVPKGPDKCEAKPRTPLHGPQNIIANCHVSFNPLKPSGHWMQPPALAFEYQAGYSCGNAVNSYSGVPQFESRVTYGLTAIFVVFSMASKEIPGYYLEWATTASFLIVSNSQNAQNLTCIVSAYQPREVRHSKESEYFFIWFVRLLALLSLLAYCASLG